MPYLPKYIQRIRLFAVVQQLKPETEPEPPILKGYFIVTSNNEMLISSNNEIFIMEG